MEYDKGQKTCKRHVKVRHKSNTFETQTDKG